jgi:hypothetical protein
LAVDFRAGSALDCLRQSNLAQHGYGQTENRDFFNVKTNRARAQSAAAWRILDKALRGASVRVRWVRALLFELLRNLSARLRQKGNGYAKAN